MRTQCAPCYLMTFSVTVLDADRPVLGFTVTVAVQEPTLSPFKVDLDTLQNLDDLLDTFNDAIDPVLTFKLAKLAIDFAVSDFPIFSVMTGATVVPATNPTDAILVPILFVAVTVNV